MAMMSAAASARNELGERKAGEPGMRRVRTAPAVPVTTLPRIPNVMMR